MAGAPLRTRFLGTLGACLAVIALAATASADPPGRVGRISFTSGPVSFRPAGLDQWGDASLNYPMTTGDRLWTDDSGRAEIQMGSVVARLAADTAFSLVNLDNRVAQMSLTQGSLAVSVRDLRPGDGVEVDTPNGAVSLLQPGFYRLDVNADGNASTVSVREGEGEVTSAGQTIDVFPNQSAVLSGIESTNVQLVATERAGEWEDWCRRRERSELNAVSARYVSPDTLGYSDLDDFGRWERVDQYGAVWVPNVAPGWAPYREGRWAWVEPWGWTWVDDEPWGFAPFHYGRWARLETGWGWVPGVAVERPVYAPALVAFVGGGNFGAAFGVGDSLGWFPLGPGEPYLPAYEASPAYVSEVNLTNVNVTNVNATNINYANRTVPGAVTAVPRDAFVAGRPVASVARAVPVQALRTARVLGTAAPVAPVAASLVARRGSDVRTPPSSVAERRVVARTPPPAAPVPFAARQRALAADPGKPVDQATLQTLRPRSEPSNSLVKAVVAPAPGHARPAEPPSATTGTSGRAPSRPSDVRESRPETRPPAAETTRPPERPPEGGTPPRVPPEAVKPPNPEAGSLAAQHRAEARDLEARHASETAQLRERQAQEQKQARNAHEREQIEKRQQAEAHALEQRQVQEHQQMQQRQQNQKAQEKAHEQKKGGGSKDKEKDGKGR